MVSPLSSLFSYPIFVTRKKKTAKFAETAITRCIPFSFADDVSDTEWEKEAAVLIKLRAITIPTLPFQSWAAQHSADARAPLQQLEVDLGVN